MMLYYLLLHICIAFRYLGQNPYLSYQCFLNIISIENMLNVLRHSDSCHKIYFWPKHRGRQTAALNSHTHRDHLYLVWPSTNFPTLKTPNERGLTPTGDLFPVSQWICIKLPVRCMLGFVHNSGRLCWNNPQDKKNMHTYIHLSSAWTDKVWD